MFPRHSFGYFSCASKKSDRPRGATRALSRRENKQPKNKRTNKPSRSETKQPSGNPQQNFGIPNGIPFLDLSCQLAKEQESHQRRRPGAMGSHLRFLDMESPVLRFFNSLFGRVVIALVLGIAVGY